MISAPYPFGAVPAGQCDCPTCRLRDWHYRAVPGSLGEVIDWLADECRRCGMDRPTIGVSYDAWGPARLRWTADICGHDGEGTTEWQALQRAWDSFARVVRVEADDVIAIDASHCGRTQ